MGLSKLQAAPGMQVPLLDLKPQYQELKSEILAAIEKVCASQAFILGPDVKELESERRRSTASAAMASASHPERMRCCSR